MKFDFNEPGISFQQIWWAFNRHWPFAKPRKLKKAELDFLKSILREHHIVLSSIEYVHNGGKTDLDIFDKVKFQISKGERKGNWIGMMRVPYIHPYTSKWKKWTENSDLFPTSEAIVALLSSGPFFDPKNLDFDKSFGKRKNVPKDLEDWLEGPFYAWDPISIGCTKLEDFSYTIRSFDWIEILKAASIYGQYMNMFKEDKYRPQSHKGKYTHWDSAWESWDWSSRNSKFKQAEQNQKTKFTVHQGGKGSKQRRQK